MQKSIFTLALLYCTLLSSNLFAQSSHFYTQNGKLKDPCGNVVTLRGVNYAVYNWGWDANETYFREIAKTGSNCVRIVWYANNGSSIYANTTNLARAIDSCLANKMIPIIDLHDQTCANNPSAVLGLMSFFNDANNKAVLQARQNKIILNLANESLHVMWAGDPAAAQTTYLNTYNTFVSNMRTAGYHCPLMIDAPDCAQNSDVLVTVGSAMLAADTDHNLIFSPHSYWAIFANNDVNIMTQKVQNLLNAGIPFVIGEAANYQDDATYCQYTLPYIPFLTACKNLGVGWIVWGWNRDNCAARQMSDNGLYTGLSAYGNAIVNDAIIGLHTTAIRSPYILNNSCPVATENTNTPPNIGIYPNPTQNLFTVNFGNFWLQNTEAATLNLYDTNGRLLLQKIAATNSNTLDIEVQNLPKGLYFLQIQGNKTGCFNQKIQHN